MTGIIHKLNTRETQRKSTLMELFFSFCTLIYIDTRSWTNWTRGVISAAFSAHKFEWRHACYYTLLYKHTGKVQCCTEYTCSAMEFDAIFSAKHLSVIATWSSEVMFDIQASMTSSRWSCSVWHPVIKKVSWSNIRGETLDVDRDPCEGKITFHANTGNGYICYKIIVYLKMCPLVEFEREKKIAFQDCK